MQKGLNELVPADELHWDADSGSYRILSKEQTDELIEACLVSGVDRPADISKVVKEYEMVRGGTLLFDQFLSGKVAVCGFNEAGSPVFEPKDTKSMIHVDIKSHVGPPQDEELDAELVGERHVCANHECGVELYKGVMAFCEKWGVDILAGDNPDLSDLALESAPFMADLKRRGWSVVRVEAGEDATCITVRLSGPWFRTKFRA